MAVLLVLLVIFLAALPLSQTGLDTKLPAATQPASPAAAPGTHIMVEYSGDRRISINHQDVNLMDLEAGVLRVGIVTEGMRRAAGVQ